MARSDSPAIIGFLDQELRATAGFSVRDEYPALFGDFPGGHSIFVQSGERVIAHVAILTRVLRHTHFHFKIGLIGSVITAADYRGHGIASTLMREAVAQLKNQGCLLAMLWGDNTAFYKPLGFERAGREQCLYFSPDRITPGSFAENVFPFDPKRHAEGVWRLYLQHDLTVDRSLQEFKRLCRVPHSRLFVTTEGETVTSYIAINKGLDFPDCIHEWGGRPDSIRANIARVQKLILPDRALSLIAPAHVDLGYLKAFTTECHQGVLGYIRLLDRTRLRAVYLDYLKAVGEKPDLGEEWGGDGRTVSTKTDGEFLVRVLGNQLSPAHPVLPLFLWGLDSI